MDTRAAALAPGTPPRRSWACAAFTLAWPALALPTLPWPTLASATLVLATLAFVPPASAQLVRTTLQDFHLSGTQIGDAPQWNFQYSGDCMFCHGPLGEGSDPYATWSGSLMANAGRDPLFYAQMTTANQDVANAGYFCMRCHVPMSFISGHAYQPDGSTLDDFDMDGVSCHFCHSMVDPIYKPGISPPEDLPILQALAASPEFYGNAMFVLDPNGLRRGPYKDAVPSHQAIYSPFLRSGDMCGTCHDVGNVAVSRLPDGTYRYNQLDAPPPTENPCEQFPLERTYTEWKLSAFANGGVNMGGRFGGNGGPVVSSCQDCHMPRTVGQGCAWAPVRTDLARHDFAGASAWVLQIIGLHYQDDPYVDQEALEVGQAKAIDMLQRAASLDVAQQCDSLRVRVINESGHKLPTGHIEGRRVWVNVKLFDQANTLLAEYGHYDLEEAELDEGSTTVYEMHVGLSRAAAAATGLPPGVTTHMALADTIVKDNRIPPRGFVNQNYEDCGAPVVGAVYADGQHWADTHFAIPPGTVRAKVTVNYQTVTRHYIEALRDGNVTNDWGQILYNLWLRTDKGPPIEMVSQNVQVTPPRVGDVTCDGRVNIDDLFAVIGAWGPARPGARADIDHNGQVDVTDLFLVLMNWG
jgi:hypothetical protein